MSAFPPSNTFLCRLRSLIIPLKDYKEIYKGLFESESFINKYGKFDTSFINKKEINYDDSLIFIYLKGLLEGFPYNGILKQVIIDSRSNTKRSGRKSQ